MSKCKHMSHYFMLIFLVAEFIIGCLLLFRFHWEHTSTLKGESQATVTWDIPPSTIKGDYRIVHSGYYKPNLTNGERSEDVV